MSRNRNKQRKTKAESKKTATILFTNNIADLSFKNETLDSLIFLLFLIIITVR